MQQNIGLLDRYIRLFSGLVALAGGANLRRNSLTKTALISFGAMKVAEGVTGWCPVMHACGIQTTPDQESQSTKQDAQQSRTTSATATPSSKSQIHNDDKGKQTSQHRSMSDVDDSESAVHSSFQ